MVDDKKYMTAQVECTFGYVDLEYFWSSHFTEKSDTCSFKIVLVKLLTRERPIHLNNY